MADYGELGAAFVRIRPDLASFRREAQAGIKDAFRGLGTLRAPGLQQTRAEISATGQQLSLFGNEAVQTSRKIRTAREQEVRATVAGQIRERRALEETLVAARALAAGSVQGSVKQIEANRLAARSAEQLGLEMSHVERRALSATAGLSKLERGALAGSGAFRGYGRNLAFASLGFIGAYGFVGAVRSALEESGDLNTQIARSVTVFGQSGRSVQTWSRESSRYLGYARESALEAANAFGTIFSASGLGSRQAASFAEDLTKVAAAASLARGESDPSRSEAAFRIGLTGRGRALRQYGIILDQTAIKAKAAELGLVKTTADPTKIFLAQRRLAEAAAGLQEARAKGSPLQQAKAEDAVTVAQQRLRTTIAGTTGEVSRQATAIAAHAIIMEQGKRFVDRYGASLQTQAGRSRRFHEGISELKEELGNALYPAFAQTTDGIIAYTRSLGEGGSRHEQFKNDLHDLATAGHDFYLVLRLLGGGLDRLATAVGGVGNLVEILGFVYAANKALVLAHAIRDSRLALLLLGEQAPATATSVVAAEAEMSAGAVALGGRLATARAASVGFLTSLGRLARIGTIAIAIDLIINKKDRDKALDFLKGSPGSQQNKSLHDIVNVGQGIADAATQIAKGNPFHSGHTLGYNRPPPPKTQADASSEAAKLRKGNYGEDYIYRSLRADGFSSKQAEYAVIATRERTRSLTLRPPSPEDVRTAPGARTGQAGPSARQAATASLNAIAKEIDSGGKLTQAKAKRLEQELAAAVADIGNAGFGPRQKAALVAKANALAQTLATAASGIGTGTVAALRKDRAEIRKELAAIGQEITQQRADMQTAITDAINSAAQAERDAVQQAKSNLNSLGASLADSINRFIDAQSEKAQAAPSGPLAARLKRLTDLIHGGKATPELIREAEKVESELNAQSGKQGADATARKDRINRRLADLTDELNTGKISLAKFNREVTALLKREHVTYRAAGQTLGVAFADGFRIALKELREQAAAIVATPAKLRRSSTGLETQVIRPLQVLREQNRNIARVEAEQQRQLRDLIARRHELLLKEQSNSHKIARAQRARLIELARSRPAKPEPTPQRKGAARRDRAGAPSPEDVRVGLHFHTASVEGQAKRSGRGIGVSLGEGVEAGIYSLTDRIAAAAAETVRRAVRQARRAARIHSPSEFTRDEIGVPLGEGVIAGLEAAGAGLGDALVAQIREGVHRGRRAAGEREIGSQARGAAGDELERAVIRRPHAATASILDREAVRRATRGAVSPALAVGDFVARDQRGLLLGEERKHTRLLEQILGEEKRQTVLLREDRPPTPHTAKRPRPRTASEEASATAIHNLLGS